MKELQEYMRIIACLQVNKEIMTDINRIFNFLGTPKTRHINILKDCSIDIPSPDILRKKYLIILITEIKNAKNEKPAAMTLKMNSLSDESLIMKLNEAAKVGVEMNLIVRGIFCMRSESKKYLKPCKCYQHRG